jgi:site-specific recombinase XerD
MKVADRELFQRIRDYLVVYLPKVRTRSESTVKSYRGIINDFLGFLCDTNKTTIAGIKTSMITAELLRCYLEWLSDTRGCAPATRNQRLSCIRSLCAYLAVEDITFMAEYSKMGQLSKVADDADSRFLWLTLDQIRLILSLPDPSSRYGIRDLAYLTLLYDSAVRNGELLDVLIDDVHRDGYCSIRVTGKGGKTRAVPISDDASEILGCYLERYHPAPIKSRHLFYTVRCGIESAMSPDNAARIMTKYELLAKESLPDIPHLHPHLFRHSRSMHLYKAGMPLPLLAEWLGHSQMETTLIYAHADTEMKRKAIDAAMGGMDPIVEPQAPVYNDDEIVKRLYALA